MREKKLYQVQTAHSPQWYATTIENVPEALIASEYVHPDSVSVYRKLFSSVPRGSKPIQGDVLVQMFGKEAYSRERITITPIFNQNGWNIRSIGTSTDITKQKQIEELYRRQIIEINAMDVENLIAKGRLNLTANRIESNITKLPCAVYCAEDISCDDFFARLQSSVLPAPDFQLAVHPFSREALIHQYHDGNLTLIIEYPRQIASHASIWVQTQCKLFDSPDTEDIICFICSYDITPQKTAQQMISAVVRMDYGYLALLDCRTNTYTMNANGSADRSRPSARQTTKAMWCDTPGHI